MNKFFLLQMILVVFQAANFTWAVFFATSQFTVFFAGAVMAFLCVLAFNAWDTEK